MQFLGRRPRAVVDLTLPYRNIRTSCNPLQQLFYRVSAAMMILGSLPGWNRSLVQPGCGRCWVTEGPQHPSRPSVHHCLVCQGWASHPGQSA